MKENPNIDLIEKLFDVVEMFRNAGMTHPTKYPIIYSACAYFIKHGVGQPLINLLEDQPQLFEVAKRTVTNNDLSKIDNPFLPYIEEKEIKKIKGMYSLGYVNPSFEMAGIDPLDFTYGVFIFGAMGSGKTYPVLRLLRDILSVPKEERGFNIIVVQIVKRDADFLTKTHPVNIIEWKDMRYNIWEIEPWEDIEEKISYSSNIFSAVNYFMALSKPLFQHTIKRAQDKFKKLNQDRQITFSELFKHIDAAAELDLELESFKSKEVKENLKFRFADFINTGNIMDCEHGFTVQDVWSKEDIILNIMDEQNDYLYRTFITSLMMGLQRYYSREDMRPPRLKTLLVFDECRAIFKSKKDTHDFNTDRYFEIFSTTARSCGIGRICITQEPQSLASWLTNNNAIALNFPIAGDSLEYVPKLMNLTEEQTSYIFKLSKYGDCIVRDRRLGRPYLMEIPGDLEITDFTYKESKQASKRFTEPLHEQLAEKSKHKEDKPKLSDLPIEMQRILNELKNDPFASFTELRTKTNLGAKMKNLILNTIDLGLIEEKIYRAGQGKNTRYFALTETAQNMLQLSYNSRISSRLFLHSLYAGWVCEYLEAKKLTGLIEFTGKSYDDQSQTEMLSMKDNDGLDAEIKARIDVYCPELRTAFEITRSDLRHLNLNIFKCFSYFKDHVDKLFIVCESKQILDDAANIINRIYGDKSQRHIYDRITLTLIRDIRKQESETNEK